MAHAPMTVAVVGATGFVGRYLVARLQEGEYRIRAVSRDGGRRSRWNDRVEAMAADITNGEGLAKAFAGADAVVHLVAIPRETRGRSFETVNVEGVRTVVEAAQAAGVRRFVHLSALGVADDDELGFLQSKWRGEEIVRASDLEWVILRPSLLFGPGDGFFSLIDTTLKWWSPGVVAIPGDGKSRFQPLSVEDLAIAIERSIRDADRSGSVYELGGPEYVTYRQIVDRVMVVTGRRRIKLFMPIFALRGVTRVTDVVIPIFPVTNDQIRSLDRPNWTELDAFEQAFGVAPRPFDLSYMRRRAA